MQPGEVQTMIVITRTIITIALLAGASAQAQQQRLQAVTPEQTPPAAQTAQPRAGAASLTNAMLLDGNRIEAVARAVELPKATPRQDQNDLNRMAALLRDGKRDEANSVWVRVVQRHAAAGKDHDKWINVESIAYTNYVLNRAYIEPDPALKVKAAKVREMPAHEATHVVQQPATARSAGDDAQLANLDLQNALQKQQQTYTMMSNVMKTMHDTSKSIIQNVK
jgi:hypothetical protein